MKKSFAAWGALFALTATVLGALGAHSLKPLLTPEHLESFRTATQYQFYHALGLLFLALLAEKRGGKLINAAGYLMVAGVFCFSGSIYLLSTTEISHLEGLRFLGPVTPLGGLCFISGWTLVLISLFSKK